MLTDPPADRGPAGLPVEYSAEFPTGYGEPDGSCLCCGGRVTLFTAYCPRCGGRSPVPRRKPVPEPPSPDPTPEPTEM